MTAPFVLALVCSAPLWVYFVFLIAGRLCFLYSRDHMFSARRAERGAQAERRMAGTLNGLPPGWSCEAGIFFEGFGDIDFFIRSPKGKAFVIDVKSHKGEVIFSADESKLKRIVDGREKEFEKDVLKGARSQALRMSQERNINYVIPMLAFTKAKVSCQDYQINKVYVLEENEVLKILQEEESRTAANYQITKNTRSQSALLV